MHITIRKVQNKLLRKWKEIESYQKGKNIISDSNHASPDFMIIGAAKCGTTSLFQYLAQHPKILTPQNKEIKYFGMQNQSRGLQWYLNQFPLKEVKNENKLTFEATPTYIYLKKAPKAISFLYPQMKSIAILRDPVKRAYSHWTWQQDHSVIKNRNLIDNRTFEEAVEQELTNPNSIQAYSRRYLDRGKYAIQLKRWYQYFDKEQILILDFHDLKTDLNKTLESVTQFLNIENTYKDFSVTGEKLQGVLQQKDDSDPGKLKKYNSSLYKETLKKDTEEKLRDFFTPFDYELQQLTGRKFSWMK